MRFLFLLFLLSCFSNILPESNNTQKRKDNLNIAEKIGKEKGLPRYFAESMAWEESRGYETAVGKNNIDIYCSFGLFQINETCEKELADRYLSGGHSVYDRFNPEHSATIGIGYILFLHNKYGNWKEALCAYNWGPGNVDRVAKYSDIPLRVRKYTDNIINRIKATPYNYLK